MQTDEVLAAERAYLETSRAALRQMQADAADWQTATGGDAVSTQYLKQMLYRRAQELVDDPNVPLFFGRLDFAKKLGADRDETSYIGRRHVTTGPGGDPLVIDWRAPISRAFYQARPADPMCVELRRRFGFSHGELSAYEDESLTTSVAHSALLEAEIERPRTGPMRDIVATIQPDQDNLVRTELETSLCIQGAPGTGKTAVGLHRAAFLLYTYRDRLAKAGVFVIGPSEGFLDYIADVLPALGEIDATQYTIDTLLLEATGARLRGSEPADVACLKGDARLAEVLSRAVWSHVAESDETLAVPIGHRTWRVSSYYLNPAIATLRGRGVRYMAGRELVAQRLAHQVLLRMEVSGEVTDDRLQNQVARSKPVRAYADKVWPAVTAPKVLHRLLSDREFLAKHSDGLLTPEEQELLLWEKPPRTPGTAKWTTADLALLDELGDLLHRTPSQGHVIIDEAQDLSAMQLRAAGRRASTGSVTLLGDLAQATTPWALTDWRTSLAHVGKPDAPLTELVEGFRVPGNVLDYAAQLLPSIAPELTTPRAMRRSKGDLEIRQTDDLEAELWQTLAQVMEREGTIGVIVPNGLADTLLAPADERVQIVPAKLAKGLEFDHVILIEPAELVADEPDRITGLRRLYVCLTRAVTSLVVLHTTELPRELGQP